MPATYIPDTEKAEIAEIAEMLKNVPQETRATIKGILIGAEITEQAAKETASSEKMSA